MHLISDYFLITHTMVPYAQAGVWCDIGYNYSTMALFSVIGW
jgi:hypothetical protein